MTFEEADADFKAAKARLDALIIARAKELYPNYNKLVEDDDVPGFEGGAITKASCRKEALASLRKHETAEDALAEREASRRVLRTVYLPASLDERLRIRAFREGVDKGSLIVEALTVWFDALGPEKDAEKAPVKTKKVVGKKVGKK